MVGTLAVADFRDTETWNEARYVVCALLEFTEVWSHHLKLRSVARDIERLSVSVLDDLANGCDPRGDKSYLARARHSIDMLELTLRGIQRQGALGEADSVRLQERLDALKQSLPAS